MGGVNGRGREGLRKKEGRIKGRGEEEQQGRSEGQRPKRIEGTKV